MTYQEQIKHPKWQRKRLEILTRDNFTCIKCKETEKELHVHHRYYLDGRKIWEYDNNNLVTLCTDCHKYEHDFIDNVRFKFFEDIGIKYFGTWHYKYFTDIINKIGDKLYAKNLHFYDYGKKWDIILRIKKHE